MKEIQICKKPLLIKYTSSNDLINYNKVKIIEQWGVNILFKDLIQDFQDFFTNNDYLLNYDSSYFKLALLFNDKIIGIHTQNDHRYDISVNTSIIAKAIKLNYENDFKNIKQRGNPLSKSHIEELKKNWIRRIKNSKYIYQSSITKCFPNMVFKN